MKTLRKIVAYITALAVIIYLIGAFHQGNFDSSTWTNKDTICMTYALFATFGSVLMVIFEDR